MRWASEPRTPEAASARSFSARAQARRYVARRMHAEPDAQLVRWVAADAAERRAAEAELCRRFAPRIRLYGLRHLRDEERARDLVQTVLCALLQALRAGRIDDPERVDRYVLGTCRNSVQRLRAADARARPTAGEELAEMLDDQAFAQAAAARDEGPPMAALFRCLDALDLRAKKIVHLSFQGGYATEQIAAALALTPGNVRVLRHRALRALRRCLDERARAAS
jgi:RNA polymerase sigma-70 factor (ECF subfamily)